MNWLKHNPLLGSLAILLAVALVSEAWLWSSGREQARRALAVLELKKQERDWLARQSPALNGENEEAIAGDLANTRKVLAALRTALQGRDAAILAAAPPARSLDLYFDLAAFVEKARMSAARAQVTIRPDECFGFTSHASEGPEAGLVPAVFRQRVIGQYLVETLLESHPRALLGLQRESPRTAAQRTRRDRPAPPAAAGSGEPADFFVCSPQLSVRAPGCLDSEAFRLEFTGQTQTLRAFLNALASFRLPVIVRSVEVEPMELSGRDPAMPSLAVAAPLPVVVQAFSRFAVVVECVRPGDPGEEPSL